MGTNLPDGYPQAKNWMPPADAVSDDLMIPTLESAAQMSPTYEGDLCRQAARRIRRDGDLIHNQKIRIQKCAEKQGRQRAELAKLNAGIASLRTDLAAFRRHAAEFSEEDAHACQPPANLSA